ncbi:MAG: DegV family protein [Vallitaleaceae bacterium]|jgi:DegV family protein with EDD domain|nr:DegV family protein [Vallitaleaceae bacterium]
MKIRILTDSSCDLPFSFIQDNREYVDFIGMPIAIGDEEHLDDLGSTFSHDYFYMKLKEGSMPKTSQINTMSFYERFIELVEADFAVICIGLSSGLSGTFNNANLAKNMVMEERQDAQIHIVDTYSASIGLGALVVKAVDMIKAGMLVDELVKFLEENRLRANHWFSVDDLIHLKNGGRIPAAVAYVGTVLNVKPVLTMDHEGKLESFASVRGKKKAAKYLLSKVEENLKNHTETIIVGHANIKDDADYLVREIRNMGYQNPIIETCLSATIASHVGPGMMAIAFMGEKVREVK